MKEEEKISLFFQCIGEIWRDITAIEFFMRSSIAKYEGEIDRFPKPPYEKGKIYKNPPRSFLISNFESLKKEFNKRFPKLKIPDELVELRHGMAHGIISRIEGSDTEEILKFKKSGEKDLMVEFQMSMDIPRLTQIRKSLQEFRVQIMINYDLLKHYGLKPVGSIANEIRCSG